MSVAYWEYLTQFSPGQGGEGSQEKENQTKNARWEIMGRTNVGRASEGKTCKLDK